MIVPENKIIDRILRRILQSELIKRFLRSGKSISFIMGQPVVLRPVVAEAEGQPWVEHAEKDLKEAAMED